MVFFAANISRPSFWFAYLCRHILLSVGYFPTVDDRKSFKEAQKAAGNFPLLFHHHKILPVVFCRTGRLTQNFRPPFKKVTLSSNNRRENIKLLAYTWPTTRNGCRLSLPICENPFYRKGFSHFPKCSFTDKEFRSLRWAPKGSAFRICRLLKKVDENFTFYPWRMFINSSPVMVSLSSRYSASSCSLGIFSERICFALS